MLSNDIFTNSVQHFSLYFKENDSVREWRNNVVYTNSYFSSIQFLINNPFFFFNFRLHSWRLTTIPSQKDLEIRGVEKGKKSKSGFFFFDVSINLSSLVIKGHLQEKYETSNLRMASNRGRMNNDNRCHVATNDQWSVQYGHGAERLLVDIGVFLPCRSNHHYHFAFGRKASEYSFITRVHLLKPHDYNICLGWWKLVSATFKSDLGTRFESLNIIHGDGWYVIMQR